MSPALDHVWIIGPGRLGLALGDRLLRDRIAARVTLTGRGRHPPDDPLLGRPGASYLPPDRPPDSAASLILIAVPDAAVDAAAGLVASMARPPAVVLHTSGVLASGVLRPLHDLGFRVGSLHPLVPVTKDGGGSLRDAWFGVEGEPEAVRMAAAIVAGMGGTVLPLDPERKPIYHAAAVFASNYVVTALAVAERLMASAGVPAVEARQAVAALASVAVENVRTRGPAAALTGPVSRGDTGTVELHLARLSASDARLYSGLAREALRLAISRGLAPDAAAGLEELLRRSPG
jgi:predicted short-subunit dehydrogenase-like oxidoreductase (DUF2520 family)